MRAAISKIRSDLQKRPKGVDLGQHSFLYCMILTCLTLTLTILYIWVYN